MGKLNIANELYSIDLLRIYILVLQLLSLVPGCMKNYLTFTESIMS